APKMMYRVRLERGRESLITGDHNLWVRRGGELILIETSEARQGDEIPLPEALPSPKEGLEWLELGEAAGDAPARLPVTRELLERIGFFIATGLVAEETSERNQLPARLLGAWCGSGAWERRLPPFWGALSQQQLAWLLRAYFDAAAAVHKDANHINAIQKDGIHQDVIFCETRSEEHTSELQSRENLVCRLLLEKKNLKYIIIVLN